MNKDFLNRTLLIIKNIFVKILNWISNLFNNTLIPLSRRIIIFIKKNSKTISKRIIYWTSVFYKNKFLPYLSKIINGIKEFSKLISIDTGEDNRELVKIFTEAFSVLLLYLRRGGKEIKFLFSRRKELITHIKYLSYKRLILYVIILISFDIFLIWFSSYRILYAKHYWEGVQEKKFFIRPGKSLDEIIDDLKQSDILESRFIFKVYVKLSGKEDKIISRRYLFNSGISNSELLNLLTDRNMVQMEKFTLIEGLRIKQIARIAESRLQLSQELFIKETENDSLINILGLKGRIKNLEGFLFPDTYFLPLDVDERGLVNILFNEFRKKVLSSEEIMRSIKEENKNLLDVIILASIIQGETNLREEMGTISGVYHNRLRKKMKLEADPTIQYVLPDGPKPRLKYSDLKINSPYNTYRYAGLPPGPINNPGLHAIKSSINPESNNFLFFVATGNGGHKFSETYQEHLKAVEEYRKNTEKKGEQ